jgi:CRP-like cAMP-binding protein
LTNCEIKTIKRGLFFSSTDLITKSLKRIDQLEKLLLISNIKKSEEKLKEFLLYLSSIIGLKKDKHIYLNLKEFNFTHKIIGNSISSTRVTVTRNLKILEKKGWLKFEKKGILIPFKDN